VGIDIESCVHALVLIRQDDVPSEQLKQKCDARDFLTTFAKEIRKEETHCSEHALQDSFFLLGRCSMALLFTCPSLSDIAELMRFMTKVHRKTKEKTDVRLGNFEPFCFPSARVLSKGFEYAKDLEEKPIPAMVFVRASGNLVKIIRGLATKTELMKHVFGIYLGAGIYNMIFYLRFKTLYELGNTIVLLRKELKSFWETSTLVGVPARKNQENSQAKETEKTQFSISAKCTNGLESVACRILKISPEIENVFFRQGYMDIEVHYSSKSVSDAFDLACAIRKIEGVIDTCSVVQLSACTEMSKSEQGRGI
jgi:hypothetical protein